MASAEISGETRLRLTVTQLVLLIVAAPAVAVGMFQGLEYLVRTSSPWIDERPAVLGRVAENTKAVTGVSGRVDGIELYITCDECIEICRDRTGGGEHAQTCRSYCREIGKCE